MRREIEVTSRTPMPKAYGFLPKGDRYKTLHCRKLTHENGRPLYIVLNDKKQTTGIRIPLNVLHKVHDQAKDTLSTRRAATVQRDAADIAKAAAEVDVQFPKIPAAAKETVLRHGFKKNSGRVGRTSSIPLSRKVLLAVLAHVRHMHTEYDTLLKKGKSRDVARKTTRKNIEVVVKKWGYPKGMVFGFRYDERMAIARKRSADTDTFASRPQTPTQRVHGREIDDRHSNDAQSKHSCADNVSSTAYDKDL
ncbi:hypothetical protein G6011_03490 [Alternaria panax]|uniref:DUF2293 domain-containing protein n=1 Tax=Alternaria panax TaxID=48097 RepID=A0AAD4IF60_9PLEO|nr:hypothetical protein G6011_03490 [Alternaria panax]